MSKNKQKHFSIGFSSTPLQRRNTILSGNKTRSIIQVAEVYSLMLYSQEWWGTHSIMQALIAEQGQVFGYKSMNEYRFNP